MTAVKDYITLYYRAGDKFVISQNNLSGLGKEGKWKYYSKKTPLLDSYLDYVYPSLEFRIQFTRMLDKETNMKIIEWFLWTAKSTCQINVWDCVYLWLWTYKCIVVLPICFGYHCSVVIFSWWLIAHCTMHAPVFVRPFQYKL